MATSKLTLTMDPEVVHAAKKFAKEKNINLSKLVENYLRFISKRGTVNFDDFEISDWVKEMVAVDKPTSDFDHKKEYRQYIIGKYSK